MGSRSSPAMISAGSPGSSCCRPKISIDTRISVGMICSSRRVRKTSILLELQSDHAHQPVGHLPVAVELVAVRHQYLRMIEVEDRTGAFRREPGRDILVRGLAVGCRALGARLVLCCVDLGIAELGVV